VLGWGVASSHRGKRLEGAKMGWEWVVKRGENKCTGKSVVLKKKGVGGRA